MRYLETHETIANRHGREICYIHSENTMKHILKSMVDAGLIMVIKGKTVFDTVYKKIEK